VRGGLERLDGVHVVLEALRAKRRVLGRLLVAGTQRGRGIGPGLGEVLELAEASAVPVEWLEPGALQSEGGAANAQRVALEAGPLPELGLAELLEATRSEGSERRLVLLDGVEDPQNLGAIARVAETSGVAGLVLGRRHAPPLSAAAARASAGALEWLPVARVGNLAGAIAALKQDGFWVLAADSGEGDCLFDVEPRVLRGDLVVVLGSEGRGLRPGIAGAVDHRVRIPLSGHVESLNVATAGAVVLFELARRSREAAGEANRKDDSPEP